jgi:hypothetical protein
MKRLSMLFAIVCALLTGGCVDPVEKRTSEEVGSQLQRGMSGQGQIGPIDRPANDPAGEHGVPQTHP